MSTFEEAKKSYRDVASRFSAYWRAYGGRRSVFGSPYFHAAVAVTVVGWPIWRAPQWWDLAIQILPSMLGFTLSGYIALLTFGSETLRRAMRSKGKSGFSLAEEVSATFVHFLLLQALGLLAAILAKCSYLWVAEVGIVGTIPRPAAFWIKVAFWGPAFLLLVYSITAGIAVVFWVASLVKLDQKAMAEEDRKAASSNQGEG